MCPQISFSDKFGASIWWAFGSPLELILAQDQTSMVPCNRSSNYRPWNFLEASKVTNVGDIRGEVERRTTTATVLLLQLGNSPLQLGELLSNSALRVILLYESGSILIILADILCTSHTRSTPRKPTSWGSIVITFTDIPSVRVKPTSYGGTLITLTDIAPVRITCTLDPEKTN
jgi:hypothetical protein